MAALEAALLRSLMEDEGSVPLVAPPAAKWAVSQLRAYPFLRATAAHSQCCICQ